MRPLLQMQNISKNFFGVKALDRVNFNVYPGRVMALIGENGAGKSTLMKIMGGACLKDHGSMIFEDRRVTCNSIRDSKALGIGIVHQELNLVGELKVYENIFLAQESSSLLGILNHQQQRQEAKELLDKLNFNIDVNAQVKNLSIAQQQLVEIAKCLLLQAKVIVFDEPTDALTQAEVEQLFVIIEQLKSAGRGIVYISHRLPEIFTIADDVTVLRDGVCIGQQLVTDISEESLIQMMVGRSITEQFPYCAVEKGEVLLKVRHLSNEFIKDISLDVHEGEVLGVAGLIGSGRSDLAKSIIGVHRYHGSVDLRSQQLKSRSIHGSLKQRIVYVSEDRKQEGLVLSLSIADNMSLSLLTVDKRPLHRLALASLVERFMAQLRIKAPDSKALVGELSGGNQQKVAIAKALLLEPTVLILDEPTRGVDVGAKKEIYELINSLKQQGLAIVLISSEMPEVMGLSDRIFVMHKGQLKGCLERSAFDAQKILALGISD